MISEIQHKNNIKKIIDHSCIHLVQYEVTQHKMMLMFKNNRSILT